jgi:hypothetical protein
LATVLTGGLLVQLRWKGSTSPCRASLAEGWVGDLQPAPCTGVRASTTATRRAAEQSVRGSGNNFFCGKRNAQAVEKPPPPRRVPRPRAAVIVHKTCGRSVDEPHACKTGCRGGGGNTTQDVVVVVSMEVLRAQPPKTSSRGENGGEPLWPQALHWIPSASRQSDTAAGKSSGRSPGHQRGS